MLRAIFWDNDGVLVDSERVFYEANRDYFLGHGIELGADKFFEWFLEQDCGAWHLLEARGMSPEQIVRCRAERNERYSERLHAQGELPIPGIAALLEALHPRVAMAVVTSSSREHFDTIHRNSGLRKYFRFVLTADTYARAKPAPDPYLKALAEAQAPAHECVAIEDSPRGLAAANAAGLRCIVIRTPLTRDHAFRGAYRVVDSVAELGDEVEALLSAC